MGVQRAGSRAASGPMTAAHLSDDSSQCRPVQVGRTLCTPCTPRARPALLSSGKVDGRLTAEAPRHRRSADRWGPRPTSGPGVPDGGGQPDRGWVLRPRQRLDRQAAIRCCAHAGGGRCSMAGPALAGGRADRHAHPGRPGEGSGDRLWGPRRGGSHCLGVDSIIGRDAPPAQSTGIPEKFRFHSGYGREP